MKYVIDDAVAEKMGLTLPQVLALMLIKTGEDIRGVLCELLDKKAIISVGTNSKTYQVTEKYNDLYKNIIIPNTQPNPDRLKSLAINLRKIYPAGKKPGTPYPWQDSIKGIMMRLNSFFTKYGTEYTDEQIIDATRNYVASYNGDYTLMRLLKYFIWNKKDGVESSDLAAFLDTAEQENADDSNWLTELR